MFGHTLAAEFRSVNAWAQIGMTTLFRNTALAFVLTAAMATIGCTPSVDLRGNLPQPEDLAKIEPGKTTRDEVQILLGTPSSIASYGDESWQYISARTETVAFFKPELKERKVVSINFDRNGVVKNVQTLGMDDGIAVQPIARETPTPGKDLSILEQLVGNVGKFSKDSKGSGGGAGP